MLKEEVYSGKAAGWLAPREATVNEAHSDPYCSPRGEFGSGEHRRRERPDLRALRPEAQLRHRQVHRDPQLGDGPGRPDWLVARHPY